MYIEIADGDLFEAVKDELSKLENELLILNEGPDWEPEYTPGSGLNVIVKASPVSPDVDDSERAWRRWADMLMASKGVRTWGGNRLMSPTRAGEEPRDVREVITDAQLAEGKAAYVAEFGVNYLGRVNMDPRTIVLVDYRGDKLHNPHSDARVEDLLASLPEDVRTGKTETSWTSFGIASTSNVKKLRDFVEYFDQTNFLAYSDGAKAKLRHLGRDFGEVEEPRSDAKYGISLRGASSMMRPWA